MLEGLDHATGDDECVSRFRRLNEISVIFSRMVVSACRAGLLSGNIWLRGT